MSDQNWRPGHLDLPTTHVIANEKQTYSTTNDGGGYDARARNNTLRPTAARDSLKQRAPIDSDYQQKLINLPDQIQMEISNSGAIRSTTILTTDPASIAHDKVIIDRLTQQKSQLLQNSLAEANSFYGSDPHNKSEKEYINAFNSYLQQDRRPGETYQHWVRAYSAGYTAKLYSESIRLLNERSHQLGAAYMSALARQEAERQAQAAALALRAKAEAEHAARVATQIAKAKADAEYAASIAAQTAKAKADAEYAARIAAQIAQAEHEAREEALWEAEKKKAKERVRKREAKKQAERRKKIEVASKVAADFDSMLNQFTQNRPEDIDEKLLWMKDRYQGLRAKYLEVSKAENAVGGFYRAPGKENRWNALNNVQNEIKTLIRLKHKIEIVQIPPASGAIIAVRPLVSTTDGLIAGFEGSPFSLNNALSTLNSLRTAITSGPISTFLALVFYSPSLGNGEIQRNPIVLTIPLAQLDPDKNHERIGRPATLYGISRRVTSSIRGDHTQLILESTDYSFPVRVRQAVLDSTTNQYTFTTEGLVPITLTWTPKSPPGIANSSSTELPITQSPIRIYPGARVTQVDARLDEHPACSHDDPDDYILEFPIESGIESIYMMATRGGPRYEPGTATGKGQEVGENWLAGATQPNGSPVPTQIADQLRGQDFRSFDRFREKFWRSVAADPKLSKQFSKADLKLLTNGAAPSTDEVDSVGRRDKYEIHHIEHIKDGGEVYNIDNLTVITPSAHIELHKNGIKP
ncbi:S-type pyocin domain-containing protein [Pseudomonas fluorescens]|uniref:HNH nuclease domain-containing protein n=1 Tax=Pseudomonas fluorescens TaxID=294 RepID=A0A5E6P8L3_PSEFL|nr:S-type pyocin domain-containing protein [Pseudomonas fluorescens]VVM39050.1 hypothetical protein PS655_00177 [Pseudomonas fluorescens]